MLGVGISEMDTGLLSSQVCGCALWEERGWRGPFGALGLCTSSPPSPPPALYEIGENTGSENSERFSASLRSLCPPISAFCSAKAMSECPGPWLGWVPENHLREFSLPLLCPLALLWSLFLIQGLFSVTAMAAHDPQFSPLPPGLRVSRATS